MRTRFTLERHSPSSCVFQQVADLRTSAQTEQAVQRRLLGVRRRRQRVARAGRAPRPRTVAASRQPRDKVSISQLSQLGRLRTATLLAIQTMPPVLIA